MPLDLKVLDVFPTPLVAARLVGMNNKAIVDIVYALREAGFTYSGPGLGGCQTQGNLFKVENPALRQLADAFEEMIARTAKPNHHILQMLAWAVIGQPGDPTLGSRHNHLPWHFSAVYYPQVPRGLTAPEGNLVLFDPREVFVETGQAQITPEEGLMVMFPSWLKHSVVPLRTADADRVSISLNAMVGAPPDAAENMPPHRVKKRPPGVVLPQEADPDAPEHFPYPQG